MTDNPVETDNQIGQSESVKCKYCDSCISKEAKICSTCHHYKRWWRNYLRAEHIGLLIAFGIMIVSYMQFNEARKDRVKAQEALDKVSDVNNKVKSLDAKLAEAQKRIDELNILKEAAQKGTQDVAKILEYSRSLQVQIEEGRKQLEKIDKRLSDFPKGPPTPSLDFLSSRFISTEAGLRGVVTFKPTTNASLSAVEFKVSVLPESIGRIIKISPGIPVSLMVSSNKSDNGRMANLKYTVVGDSLPSIVIELSGPAKLRIEGAPNIKSITINADNK
jgi:hypothetical protein